jgi:hypothetical protein
MAAAMIAIALYCASRPVAAHRWRRETELDVDGTHVLMGVVMAGMLAPRLNLDLDPVWLAAVGVATAWFCWRTARSRWRGRTDGGHRPHQVPHLIQCTAMLYMLWLPLGRGRLPGLALALTLFLLAHVVLAVDRIGLAGTARGQPTARRPLAPRLAASCEIAMGITMSYMLVLLL